jgi:catechol 2,3-dioxygenase-like lactoylglutathione lyase family enzyme
MTLRDGRFAARLPAQDLERARRFYSECLDLEPTEERPGGLRYHCGGTEFVVYQSTGASPGTFTQGGFAVDDLDATMADLRARGVVFQDYDVPGLTTVAGVAVIDGQYPSSGAIGERAAWFHDSEGNLLGIGELISAPA